MTLILPDRYKALSRFDEMLNERSPQRFADEIAVTTAMINAINRVCKERKMSKVDSISAVLCALVSSIQAIAPASEWSDVGEVVARAIRDRLTVTGER